jgi:hypothetical protein
MVPPNKALPVDILARATLRGNEHAWQVTDIPIVIEAARAHNLINIGGQLQFRLTDDKICECYWVEVDTFREIDENSPWTEKVTQSANVASRQFGRLIQQYDFLAEGKSAFAEALGQFEMSGGSVEAALCFVWYVMAMEDTVNREFLTLKRQTRKRTALLSK